MTGSRYAQANHDIAARLQTLAETYPQITGGAAIARADLGYGSVVGMASRLDPARLDDMAEALLKTQRRVHNAADRDVLFAAYLLLKLRQVRLNLTQEPTP